MNEFLQKIEDFLQATGMPPTTFGLKAVNTSRFVFDLRKGSGCTVATMDKAKAFMEDYLKNNEREKNGKQN